MKSCVILGDIDLKSLWSLDRMQAYMALIKTLQPRMSEGAGRVLQAYYRAQRGADDRNAARTTMRLLQSMIRLAQGKHLSSCLYDTKA